MTQALSPRSEASNSHYALYKMGIEKTLHIPNECMQIARDLELRSSPSEHPVIFVPDSNDLSILELFFYNAKKYIEGGSSWYIECVFNKPLTMEPHSLGNTLGLLPTQEVRCPLEKLKKACNRVFFEMISGWRVSSPEKYPNIPLEQQQDPEEFEFFTKTVSLDQEVNLIRSLSEKWNFTQNIFCYSYDEDSFMHERTDKLYMWVQKTAFNAVIEKMGFVFRRA